MPRRFFRKFAVKREHMKERWFLAPFDHLLHDHRLWSIRRKTVVPATSLGLFVAFLPAPGLFLIAALAALTLRVNIPVAVLASLANNPLTMGPIYYLAYRIGAELLSIPERAAPAFSGAPSIDWMQNTFMTIWQPLLLGSVLAGAIAALIGYVLLDLVWRLSLADYKARKRNQRNR